MTSRKNGVRAENRNMANRGWLHGSIKLTIGSKRFVFTDVPKRISM